MNIYYNYILQLLHHSPATLVFSDGEPWTVEPRWDWREHPPVMATASDTERLGVQHIGDRSNEPEETLSGYCTIAQPLGGACRDSCTKV
jgi:hypothetical protein